MKRILGNLTQPLPLLFLLLLAGLMLLAFRKRKGGGILLVTVSTALLVAASYGWLSDGWLQSLEHRFPPLHDARPHRGVKWVVVLGGGLVSDPRLPVTGQLTEGSQLRVIEGIRLYRQLKGARLVVSGGPVFNDVPESRAMAELAGALGVPAGDIAQDSASMDTEAQATAVKRLVNGDSLILVTSAHHMPRSAALFAKAGLALIPGPTHYLAKTPQGFNPDRLFPNSGAIRRAEALVHEYVGMAWSRLRKKI
ncbi:MAG: ElyC/SanA/YdcF family protein [Candidatus Edwardsbacteria bacterium]|nr:ElyC/SanA/YdcF family protein [Candidatus Edwardsbacteria bacterium]